MRSSASPRELSKLKRLMRDRFGIEELRRGQEEVIRSILDRRATLALMPTGAGKSLCYQLPALRLPGTTIVVSPLIALMKDQADKLRELKISAIELHSGLGRGVEEKALQSLASGKVDFVFTTPERLSDPELLKLLQHIAIDLFVIDEAHCISQWGHDFRPAFLGLKDVLAKLGHPLVLALTATATNEVATDIQKQLGLDSMRIIDTGIYRSNLRLEVLPIDGEEQKRQALVRVLAESPGQTGIIYAATIKTVEEVADFLESQGFKVGRYHGKIPVAERHAEQDRFMRGELQAMVATNAFGLGIDKADIRFVIHHQFPASLEAYYQEAGRAGRDGQPARCLLLFQRQDKKIQSFFLGGRGPDADDCQAFFEALKSQKEFGRDEFKALCPTLGGRKRTLLAAFKERGWLEERRGPHYRLLRHDLRLGDFVSLADEQRERGDKEQDKLKRVIVYCQSALCRWKNLLEYFDEESSWAHCRHCDNCDHPVNVKQLTAALI